MENNKPRTIDEFFIEKYQKLEEENEKLKLKLEEKQRTIDEYQQEYEETYNLIEEMKIDLDIKIKNLYDDCYYLDFANIYSNSNEKIYNKYKQLFNLKEEGENEDEECSEGN